MQAKFYKQGIVAIVVATLFTLFSLGAIVAGAILTIQYSRLWSLIVVGSVLFVLSIFVLLSSFQEVILTEESIELKLGKKQLIYIYWTNVTNVKVTPRGRGTSDLTFLEDNKRIDIVLIPKTFNAFMDICPDIGIKYQVKEFPAVQSLMKRYLKKKDDSHKNK